MLLYKKKKRRVLHNSKKSASHFKKHNRPFNFGRKLSVEAAALAYLSACQCKWSVELSPAVALIVSCYFDLADWGRRRDYCVVFVPTWLLTWSILSQVSHSHRTIILHLRMKGLHETQDLLSMFVVPMSIGYVLNFWERLECRFISKFLKFSELFLFLFDIHTHTQTPPMSTAEDEARKAKLAAAKKRVRNI